MLWKIGDKLSLTSLGGAEGYVGHNCWHIFSESHAVVIDCGTKPNHNFNLITPPPGINILDEVKRSTVGFMSHAHLDHIGAMGELACRDIPVYMSRESRLFLPRYFNTLKIPKGAKIYTFPDNGNQAVKNGDLEISFIPVQHSIPGTHAILVRLGKKSILYLADFKLNGMIETSEDRLKKFREIKSMVGTINCLVLDILNVEIEGFTPPEHQVVDSIENIIKEAKGRVVITFFSSNLRRMEEILKVAKSHHKSVAVFGWSMSDSYFQLTGHMPSEYGDIIFVSGSQGEDNSGLVQMARGQHRLIKLSHGDTVVNSSRCIPGNEEAVKETTKNLHEQGVRVILHQGESRKLSLHFNAEETITHFSGHGYKGDKQEVVSVLEPEIIVPFHAPEDKYQLFEDFVGGKKTKRLRIGETLEI